MFMQLAPGPNYLFHVKCKNNLDKKMQKIRENNSLNCTFITNTGYFIVAHFSKIFKQPICYCIHKLNNKLDFYKLTNSVFFFCRYKRYMFWISLQQECFSFEIFF